MTFEVWRDGERKFYTEDRRCIPSEKMQADLRKCGYKIKIKTEKKGRQVHGK